MLRDRGRSRTALCKGTGGGAGPNFVKGQGQEQDQTLYRDRCRNRTILCKGTGVGTGPHFQRSRDESETKEKIRGTEETMSLTNLCSRDMTKIFFHNLRIFLRKFMEQIK